MENFNAWDWDNVSSIYWSEPSEDVYYYLDRWKEKNFKDFMDLGCGIGRHSIFFAKNGFDTTGYDLSESGLKVLKDKANKMDLDIKIVHGNVEKLPFEDNSFDCILAYHSIYHTNSKGVRATLKEIHRVLRPEGEIYITFISKEHPSFKINTYERIDANCILKPEEDGSILPHFYIGYEDIENVLDGFKVIRVRHIEDFYDEKTGWHYFVHAIVV